MATGDCTPTLASFPTPLGTAHARFDALGRLTSLHIDNNAPVAVKAEDDTPAARLQAQVDEWFAGTRRDFEIPLAPEGTAFRKTVWEILRAIPYGQTTTYGEIAQALGKPGASRAVGQACGANPIWLVVPCHRVVGACGRLTGYAGGIDRKDSLLQHERRHRPV